MNLKKNAISCVAFKAEFSSFFKVENFMEWTENQKGYEILHQTYTENFDL